MTRRLAHTTRALIVVTLVVAATGFAHTALGSPQSGIDDANIFFAYARNVSAGEGFVFNPGGERVEGFTSLLWVLVCSAVIAVAGEPEWSLLALNVTLVSAAVLYCLSSSVIQDSQNDFGREWAAALIGLLLLDFRFVVWNTVVLMETALWTFLLTAATVLIVNTRPQETIRWRLAACVTLLVATRPEALVWGPVICGLFLVKQAGLEGRRRALAAITPVVFAYVLSAGAITMFRLVYFGAPLPNTYYAKVSPSVGFTLREGAMYLQGYLTSGVVPFACLLAIAGSITHLVAVRLRDFNTLALTVLSLTALAIPVITGGDYFHGFRFYQATYPILLLVLLNWIRWIAPIYVPRMFGRVMAAAKLGAVTGLLAIVSTLQIGQSVEFSAGQVRAEFDTAAAGRRIGNQLNRLFAGEQSMPEIGTITVGGLKYAYAGPVLDLMGLNNRRMAQNGGDRIGVRSHAAFEKSTFYELRPQLVVPHVGQKPGLAGAAERSNFVDLVLKGLLQDRLFHERYQLADVRRSTGAGTTSLAGWYERDFLTDLERSEKFEIILESIPAGK